MHIKFCYEFEIKRKYHPNFSILFSQMLNLQDNDIRIQYDERKKITSKTCWLWSNPKLFILPVIENLMLKDCKITEGTKPVFKFY